jgi:hypothetical protein
VGVAPPGEDISRQTFEQITVNLISKAVDDLLLLQERTGLSRTDVVNRAITVYEFITRQMDGGHEVLVRDGVSGETQVLRVL